MKENLIIRLFNIIRHIINQQSHLRFWSLYLNLNLTRNKHRHIITHWTKKHRKWENLTPGTHFLDYQLSIEFVIV